LLHKSHVALKVKCQIYGKLSVDNEKIGYCLLNRSLSYGAFKVKPLDGGVYFTIFVVQEFNKYIYFNVKYSTSDLN